MSTIKDGGPAFPATNYIIPRDLEERHVAALGKTQGMTLRDYFAAKAMHTAARVLADALDDGDTLKDGCSEVQVIAAAAYKLADAMLAAREGKP